MNIWKITAKSYFTKYPVFALVFTIIMTACSYSIQSTIAGAQVDSKNNSISDDTIWKNALVYNPAPVVDTWRNILVNNDDLQANRITSSVSSLFEHLDLQIEKRRNKYEEAIKDLETHIAEGDLSKALGDAIAAHEVSLDLDPCEILAIYKPDCLNLMSNTLADPRIVSLVVNAEAEAKNAEIKGDLLTAQDLFYRLDALYNRDNRYKQDVARVMQRVAVVRLYNPEKWHKIINDYRVNIGDEPRAEYTNPENSWQQQLDPINQRMVLDALSATAKEHLYQKGWPSLIKGGLDGVEVFLTTKDIYEVFPVLQDVIQRNKLLDYVKREKSHWQLEKTGTSTSASGLLRNLISLASDKTQIPEQVILHEFTEGAMATLDLYSGMIWPSEMNMFNRQLEGSFSGIGVKIILDDAYRLKVVTPLIGTPAYNAGIKANDIIAKVEGKSTDGITLQQAIDRITGRRGTTVNLDIEREGVEQPINMDVKRDTIWIDTIRGWKRNDQKSWDYIIDKESNIGYIRCSQFLPDTMDGFNEAIEILLKQDMQGLILDLRFNPGGLLAQAEDMCNRFIDRGPLVHTQDGQHNIHTTKAQARRSADLQDIPVVVLINEGSASASEIVSGCLRDHNRAVLVGTRSHGKGSVQGVLRLAGGNARLRLTTQHYLLPNGEEIHRENDSTHWGVDPHLVVRMTPEQITQALEIRENADIVLTEGDKFTDQQLVDYNPDRMINEPIDLQLQTGLLILKSNLASLSESQTKLVTTENH